MFKCATQQLLINHPKLTSKMLLEIFVQKTMISNQTSIQRKNTEEMAAKNKAN
jgi:hypothetical protein